MKSSFSGLLLFAFTCLLGFINLQFGKTIYSEISLSTGKPVPFAVHLPKDFDSSKTYPVLVGPGDAVEGSTPGYYWQHNTHDLGWIIVDTKLWEASLAAELDLLLDKIQAEYNVEGGKFHAACWSGNSAGVFNTVIKNAGRFHSITGMAGNPRALSPDDIKQLKHTKVQFVVGEKDPYWKKAAEKAHTQLKAGGIDTSLEIIPNGEHVLTPLIGAGFIERLNRLR